MHHPEQIRPLFRLSYLLPTAMFVVGATCGVARAVPVAQFPTAGPGIGLSATQTFGWQFRPDHVLEATRLGWFDRAGDGLEVSHEVALFRV